MNAAARPFEVTFASVTSLVTGGLIALWAAGALLRIPGLFPGPPLGLVATLAPFAGLCLCGLLAVWAGAAALRNRGWAHGVLLVFHVGVAIVSAMMFAFVLSPIALAFAVFHTSAVILLLRADARRWFRKTASHPS